MLKDRVKGLRKTRGYTQVSLAKAAGVTQAAISAIETGRTVELSGDLLEALCRVLHTNAAYLIRGKGDPGPTAIVSIDRREIIDIWQELDEASRDSLLLSARTLLDRQQRGKPTVSNPFPSKSKA
jgi:transcriptional regulator with XRE-family HTH domain